MKSQHRKLLYMGIMGVLLFPIFLVGLPPMPRGDGTSNPGGLLYQQRREYQLGDVTLGEVDPTSHTINLVLVGMRGVAANMLWQQAQKLQDRHQWSELTRAVKSITLLQPHFVKVWDFQGWNLSYNVANEWDNVEDRYYWVKEGIQFLQEGVEKNPRRPELPWAIGRTLNHKIGQSDEAQQFRRLFREDEVFNREREDSFIVAKRWFVEAARISDQTGRLPRFNPEGQRERTMEGFSPIVFHSSPGIAQINYARYLEKEGTFGERAFVAWAQALRDWTDLGQRQFPAQDIGAVQLDYSPEEARQLTEQHQYWSDRYGNIINYRSWKARCEAESWLKEGEPVTVQGRYYMHLADEAYADGDLFRAQELYDRAMRYWKQVLDHEEFSILRGDGEIMPYLLGSIMKYRTIAMHTGAIARGEDLPEDFPLYGVWRTFLTIQEDMAKAEKTGAHGAGSGGRRGGGGGTGTGGGDRQPRNSPPSP